MFFTRFILGNLFNAVFTAIILLFKKLFKDRISLRFHYYIWFALLFSLTVVFIPAHFFQMIGENTAGFTAAGNYSADYGNSAGILNAGDAWRSDITEISEICGETGIMEIAAVIWAVGALCAVAFYCIGIRKLRVIKRNSKVLPENIESLFEKCCAGTRAGKRISLRQSGMISSPVSFGVWRSYIVLPEDGAEQWSESEAEHILMHEIMHIKNKDLQVNMFFCAVQMIYWFNPFVWLAFSQMRRDREAYCDWRVLNTYDTDEKRLSYGYTLLKFAGRKNAALIYSANNLFESAEQLKYRIRKIAGYEGETAAARMTGRCLVAAALITAVSVQISFFSVFAGDAGAGNVYYPERSLKISEQDYRDIYGELSGCAVVYDMNSDIYNIYNVPAATERSAPYSTYKIFSALNALEHGVISSDDNVVDWDSEQYDIAAWNSDQNLDSAMKNSVNWYFQFLDKSCGADELERFYRDIGYGNGNIGGDACCYWDGSSLMISPLEQVELMVRLYNNDFGFKQENVDAVKNAIFLSENNESALYGKTGTGRFGGRDAAGWFVGYAEAKNDGVVYFFAVNVKGENGAGGGAAVDITENIFQKMGIKIDL